MLSATQIADKQKELKTSLDKKAFKDVINNLCGHSLQTKHGKPETEIELYQHNSWSSDEESLPLT